MSSPTRRVWAFIGTVLIALAGMTLTTWLQESGRVIAFGGVLGGALGGVFGAFIPNVLDVFRARIDAGEAARSLEGPKPTFVSADGAPSDLLDPRHAVVRFIGRERELLALETWCMTASAPKVHMICGPGGIGKSRLAREFMLHMGKTHKWKCVFVDDRQEDRAVQDARRRWNKNSLLLVVDYAETRAGLVEMLRQVADDPGVVRVLLIARSAGWWDGITAGLAVRKLIREADVDAQLPSRVNTDASNERIARAALCDFAAKLGVSTPQNVEFIFGPAQPRILQLHVAALVAVLNARRLPMGTPIRIDVSSVLSELLEHEERFWIGRAEALELTAGPDGVRLPTLRQLVAVASLLGARSDAELAALITRVPGLAGSSEQRRDKLTTWLTELYPPEPAHLPGGSRSVGGLQPDIVAEYLITQELAASAPLAQSCFTGLARHQAVRAMTVLARAAGDHIEASALVENAIRSEVDGGPAGDLLADVEASLMDLVVIERAIPFSSTSLAEIKAILTRRIVNSLPRGTTKPERARWLLKLGSIFAQCGRAGDALPVIEQAVTIFRDLAMVAPDRYQPDLATSLSNLGSTYFHLSRPSDALSATEQALAIREELTQTNPDRYRADLAHTLTNIGAMHFALGHLSDGLLFTERAVTIFGELAEAYPDRYRSGLADSLSNLSVWYSKLNRASDALSAIEDSLAIYRELAEAQPDRYRPDLAHTLNNLGNRIAELGRSADALPVTEQAVAIFGELAAAYPERYSAGLAASLNNLGLTYAELGRQADALSATEQAVTIRRQLTEAYAERYGADLADSLSNLGNQFAELGRPTEAAEAHAEAERLRKPRA